LYLRKELLNNVIYFRGAKTDTRGVEDTVRAAKEEDLFCDRVDHDEISVGPYIIEARKVGVVVFLCPIGAPEEDGLIGKGDWCDELAGDTIFELDAFDAFTAFESLVVDCDGGAQTWTLTPADVDWC
jgi:hypothetical protein